MHIAYHDPESRMQRPIRPNGQFLVYLSSASLTPDLTLSGEELTRLVAAHCATACLLVQTATKMGTTLSTALPITRGLLGQHKSLRQLPTSPHGQGLS
mgnify:CR=1 FL=1